MVLFPLCALKLIGRVDGAGWARHPRLTHHQQVGYPGKYSLIPHPTPVLAYARYLNNLDVVAAKHQRASTRRRSARIHASPIVSSGMAGEREVHACMPVILN